MGFGLQAGDKRVDPDELTQVSDSGERAQPTHLQREKQRVKRAGRLVLPFCFSQRKESTAIMDNKRIPQAASPLASWLSYLENLHSKTIDLGLERVSQVARKLGVLKPAPFVFTVAEPTGKAQPAVRWNLC